jgi:SAM-dependent methyltransferase
MLPADVSLVGSRALDFGCGAGRILTHAVAENPECEYWGCDIDPQSVEWLRAHLLPASNVLLCGELPPLPLPDEQFDLIWAFSVFTHLTDSWSGWLLEMHRLLKPGGALIATVVGPGHWMYGDEPVNEDVIGMNVMFEGVDWDAGGPLILHSRWWLEAHWGRAFEILDFHVGHQQAPAPLFGQSALVLRKRPGPAPTIDELERPEPGEPREFVALRQNVGSLRRETAKLRREVKVFETSRSWRMTRPLRYVVRDLKRLLRRG